MALIREFERCVGFSAAKIAKIMASALVGLALIILGGQVLPSQAATSQVEFRPMVLAGTWYPEAAKELSDLVQQYLKQVKPPAVTAKPQALIVPHAGYAYSGQVAAYGYSLLKNQDYETVVLIGPSHRARFTGAALDFRDYQTPLGGIKLDQAMAQSLVDRSAGMIVVRSDVHAQEHCLEIQMPFIQTVLPKARIVPIIMGSQDLTACRAVAKTLTDVVRGRKVLLLASSDLSHFYTGDQAKTMDGKLIDKVKADDPLGLHQMLSAGEVEACGGGPIVAIMLAAQALGAGQATILKYAHSGDVTGDNSRVVGYLAAALSAARFSKSGAPDGISDDQNRKVGTWSLGTIFSTIAWAGQSPAGVDLGLSANDQRRLLTIARETITSALDNKDYSLPANLPSSLKDRRGAFVTLKRNGELRGCIGQVTSDRPLAETVSAMAIQAAFHDPRFPRLAKEEIPGLSLEISVLTPFEPVKDVKEIQVGRHGLMIS
ncbi:MAG: AmmeMemoRadiSam system protein B, partial [Deltaproteobacteria bacterium]|nr:AmmeMemoRadiSam system protein B [Deltaproteobacteria bacterium]